jgi:hypothetical protein
MWELTSGCKPFADFNHDTDLIYKIIDGKRPEITNDTPKCFGDLINKCWDTDPSKRPHIKEMRKIIAFWTYMIKDLPHPLVNQTEKIEIIDKFNQAEKVRLELIKEEKLGPKKIHPGAIYTSRLLNSLISKSSSSISSSSTTSFINMKRSINFIIFLILQYYHFYTLTIFIKIYHYIFLYFRVYFKRS